MTSKKQRCRHESNYFLRSLLVVGLVLFSVGLILFIQNSWGEAVKFLCGFYTLATGLFFLAQIYGFVVSQTHYSEAVEAPKYTMLENEEAEWKR